MIGLKLLVYGIQHVAPERATLRNLVPLASFLQFDVFNNSLIVLSLVCIRRTQIWVIRRDKVKPILAEQPMECFNTEDVDVLHRMPQRPFSR